MKRVLISVSRRCHVRSRQGPARRLAFLLMVCAAMLSLTRPSTAAEKDRSTPKGADSALQRGFDPARIWKVTITIPPDEFTAMQPHKPDGGLFGLWKPPGVPANADGSARDVHRNTFGMDLPWATGAVTIDGQTFERVGIRYKGNGTIGDSAKSIKKSLKVDLDRLGGTDKFLNSKTINLHCGVTDPTKCRETLAYSIYRASGVPAPGTSFAEVWLNVAGKYDAERLGAYTLVEQVDSRFLRTHFGDSDGLLMKPEGLREIDYHGDDWERYKKNYVPRRDATKDEIARVVAFAKLIQKADDASFEKDIRSYIDVEAYLRFLAVTSFVCNPDCFFVLGHNYYIYLHPKTGQFHFFPWDVDLSLGSVPILGTSRQQMNLSLTRPYGGKHRLTDRLLAIPRVAERYQQLLKELASGPWDKSALLQMAGKVEATAKELVDRDRKAAESRGEDNTKNGLRAMIGGSAPSLATFIEGRTVSIQGQLTGDAKGYVPTGGMMGAGIFRMGGMLAEPLLATMDADGDGRPSKEEWLLMVKKVFSTCQPNQLGEITQQEVADAINGLMPKTDRPDPAVGPPGIGIGTFMAGPIVQRADANNDGNVTVDEVLIAAAKMFDEFDKEKSGKLNEDAFCDLIDVLFVPVRFDSVPATK